MIRTITQPKSMANESDIMLFYLNLERVQWPEGNFALLSTIYGCPGSDPQYWLSGYLSIPSTFTSEPVITWSSNVHLQGPYTSRQARLPFCIKDEVFGNRRVHAWPRGTYCIIKVGDACPHGRSFNNRPKLCNI